MVANAPMLPPILFSHPLGPLSALMDGIVQLNRLLAVRLISFSETNMVIVRKRKFILELLSRLGGKNCSCSNTPYSYSYGAVVASHQPTVAPISVTACRPSLMLQTATTITLSTISKKEPSPAINLQLSVVPTLVTLQWLYENLGCNEDRRQPW